MRKPCSRHDTPYWALVRLYRFNRDALRKARGVPLGPGQEPGATFEWMTTSGDGSLTVIYARAGGSGTGRVALEELDDRTLREIIRKTK